MNTNNSRIKHNFNKHILKVCTDDVNLRNLYQKHSSAYYDDAGIDLFSANNILVPARAISFKIPLDISLELIDGITHNNISYYLIARSSICNTPLRQVSMGVIDAGFRGKLSLIVDNMSDKDYNVCQYVKLVQVCAPDLKPIKIIVVDKLSTGSRGTKGLGSSDIPQSKL